MLALWGHLFDGVCAVGRRVRVSLDAQGLALSHPENSTEVLAWRWNEVRAGPPPTVRPTLLGPNGAMLLFDVAGLAAAVEDEATHPDITAEIRRLLAAPRNPRPPGGRRSLLTLGVAAAAILVAAFFAADLVARSLASWVPLSWEAPLGDLVMRSWRDKMRDGPATQPAMEAFARQLWPVKAGPPPAVHLADLGAANAFTLPGGTIVFDCQLVARMDGPEQFAAILAHEMGHVWLRHVAAGLLRAGLLSLLWAATVGDYSGLVAIDPSSAYNIAAMSFSREAEAAADAWAIEALAECRIDLARAGEFVRTLPDLPGVGAFLSTHPASGERAAAFAEAATRQPPGPFQSPVSQQVWTDLRAAAHSAAWGDKPLDSATRAPEPTKPPKGSSASTGAPEPAATPETPAPSPAGR